MAKLQVACFLLEILNIYFSAKIVIVSAQTGILEPTEEPEVHTQCLECSSYKDDALNPDCTADGSFNFDNIGITDCNGPCYTKGDALDSRVITRGCVRFLQSIPAKLPPEGCYDWQGATICLCYMEYCNLDPLGHSSGQPLDPNSAHEPVKPPLGNTTTSSTATATTSSPSTTTTTTTPSTTMSTNTIITTTTTSKLPTTSTASTLPTTDRVPATAATVQTTPTTRPTTTSTEPLILIECFDCSSISGDKWNPDCPVDGSLNFNYVTEVGCPGPCFTRSDVFDSRLVQRGCSSSLESLPSNLPAEGCYTWQGAIICLCYTTYCNIEPIVFSNVPLDSNDEQRQFTCIDCSSEIAGVSNTLCPFNGKVLSNASQTTCSTFCYARTIMEQNLTVRGCTSNIQGLPTVMPPSDCYNWDGATFCICSTMFCNVNKIGPSNGKSLDYLDKQISQNVTNTAAPVTVTGSLNVTAVTSPSAGQDKTIHCMECTNYMDGVLNPKCPFSGPVTQEKSTKECLAPCYYRTVASDAKLIFRGCTSHLQELPSKLPPSDCYEWEGAVFCICSSPLCNTVTIGTSTGKALDYLVNPAATTKKPPTEAVITTAPAQVTRPVMGANFTIQCYECLSFLDNKAYPFCPIDGPVDVAMTHLGNCPGPCFTRRLAKDDRVVVRGCTTTQGTLPNPLPAEGCYDWEGASFCVCYTSGCNGATIGKSKGVSLDEHIISGNPGPSDGPLQCFQCLNYNPDGTAVPQCPKNGRVNVQTVFSGNCTGACFTRTFSDNSTKVARGCTGTQYGFPEPLPPSGCYSYKGETWCICNTSQCNGGPIGVSSGTELDAHLYEIGNDFVEPDGIDKCYQCLSYFDNVYYPQCPKHGRVRNAYLAPCNGSCFSRTYDRDDKIIARGCTDYLEGLPKPLPPDGCYRWYTEIWCVCSKSRCNGAPLGTPLDIEFDAHIQKRGNGASLGSNIDRCILPILTLILFFI